MAREPLFGMVPGMFLRVARFFFLFAAFLAVLPKADAAVILQDNFDGGDRAKGNKGDINFVGAGESLNGYWASFSNPGSTRWKSIADGSASGGLWQFGGISEHPNPPLPNQTEPSIYGNGMVYGKGAGTATLPFNSLPGTAYELAADLFPAANYPGNTGADWIALGFSSSSAIGPNLANFGLAWVQLRNNGTFEFHIGGNSPLLLTGFYGPESFVSVGLSYNPIASFVTLEIDHKTVAGGPLASFFPTQIALEMNTQSNESLIAGADWIRLQTVPEPEAGVLLASGTSLLGLRRGRRRGAGGTHQRVTASSRVDDWTACFLHGRWATWP